MIFKKRGEYWHMVVDENSNYVPPAGVPVQVTEEWLKSNGGIRRGWGYSVYYYLANPNSREEQ
jgi:hypothetical protein